MRRKTPEVALLLGVSYPRITAALRDGRLNPLPERDSSGHFSWTESDIERLKTALATDRRRRQVVPA
jgi:hypothetical protein